jgi:hypothetical protein
MSAREEIRLAEARRMLGLRQANDLPTEAVAWLEAGIVSPSLDLLAASEGTGDDGDAASDSAARLLRAAAVELDLTFATTQEARTFYVRANLADLTSATGAAGIAEVSNGFTDELTGRVKRALGRLFGRRRA